MLVRTKFGSLTDDELLQLCSNLESPLVQELALRLDNALDKVFNALTVSDDTISTVRNLLNLTPQDNNTALEEMVDTLCEKYEEMTKTFKLLDDKTSAGLNIECPGCLHTFKVKLELATEEKEE